MVYWSRVLDPESDDDIKWSKSKDLPVSRHALALQEQLRASLASGNHSATSNIRWGPEAKRIKLEFGFVTDVTEVPPDRLNISNWPETLLNKLVGDYIPIEERIKLRNMCKALKKAVDSRPKMFTFDIDIRRLEQNELGLFVPRDDTEGVHVINNKKFKWAERPRGKTFKELRRGLMEWTRYDRNRMGRIKTAIRTMFKLSHIYTITFSQINLSNSFLRDIIRVLNGQCIHALKIEYQAYDYDKPNLMILNHATTECLNLCIRLKDREPLPQMERFLKRAKDVFSQFILEVRQDSWKFHSSVNYRKSYEDYGITNAELHSLMAGEALNWLRLKVVCRFITQVGLCHIIKYIRTFKKTSPSRGFCIIVNASAARNLIAEVQSWPLFGIKLEETELTREIDLYPSHKTDEEHLEVRPIKQNAMKSEIMEVRYWRKGTDTGRVAHLQHREDDDGNWDPFEQPRFTERPA